MTDVDREMVREDVIESIERSVEVYGLSRSAGRVYGVLYFADEALSIPELVDRTGYAKSTISNITRKLTRIGMIRRRSSEGGGRRVRFTPETDLWIVIQDVFRQYVQREMDISKRTLSRALDELEKMDDETGQHDLERIRTLRDTYVDLEQLLELTLNHPPDELVTAIEEYEEEQ